MLPSARRRASVHVLGVSQVAGSRVVESHTLGSMMLAYTSTQSASLPLAGRVSMPCGSSRLGRRLRVSGERSVNWISD
jgi:hypothetical protein